MTSCLFVSDMHGRDGRYRKLFNAVVERLPRAVFVGGDILPAYSFGPGMDYALKQNFLAGLKRLRRKLGERYPRVFVIFGNDDGRWGEIAMREAQDAKLVSYIHGRKEPFEEWAVYGYSFVPPTPFRLKDWERYDVSRYVDPGSLSPEEGILTVPRTADESRYATIAEDLSELAGRDSLEKAVFLFHAPPHESFLDRAGLDGMSYDHAPLDVHVGSIAVRRFIEERAPLLTLHGHIHESARITGHWIERIGRTTCISAAHDGPELALVSFDLEDPAGARRELV